MLLSSTVLLYRSYESEYLEFLKSPKATNPMTGFQQIAEKYQEGIGRQLNNCLGSWQTSAQGVEPMALKIKAAAMEPGWGFEVLFQTDGGPEMGRMVEAAARISDEAYLRARAFNQGTS